MVIVELVDNAFALAQSFSEIYQGKCLVLPFFILLKMPSHVWKMKHSVLGKFGQNIFFLWTEQAVKRYSVSQNHL